MESKTSGEKVGADKDKHGDDVHETCEPSTRCPRGQVPIPGFSSICHSDRGSDGDDRFCPC